MKKVLILAAAAAMLLPAAANAERTGEEVYKTKCFVCHDFGIAGAPKKGDAAAWEPRLVKGADGLLATATSGILAMPPKGTCMDCTDAELAAAIEHMTSDLK
ncbi:c-type cytochrome [Neptunomonas qingdaonensis]|uniref:Cytochrome C oxidase, cbb3-type, subunit III n=1 Tax=Neptunomonas qingdaonensis TaxID=1045558 RepID=A0A1I2M7X3_9GAMM|nr:c-type cytochrome [Neptunomonas qingdaonensis]SFF87574.1 Cytochrome C oxidase, cbb3-type, subunit III [Neptunomonas qingdaonensis]